MAGRNKAESNMAESVWLRAIRLKAIWLRTVWLKQWLHHMAETINDGMNCLELILVALQFTAVSTLIPPRN